MNEFEHLEECMGTVFVFRGRTDLSKFELDVALNEACARLHEADRVFSLYKPESPLSALARGETSVAKCPPEVSTVWDLCEEWEKKTGGYFKSITPQNTFDPSGLVKTWAAQKAIDVLLISGVTDFSLNAGGDIWLSDDLSSDTDWKVGISKPVSIADQGAGALAVLNLKGTNYRAVCTSGTAERGNHIWQGGEHDLVQVTVIANDLVTADVWATAAFAEGPRCIDRIEKEDGVDVLVIYSDGRIDGSNGFAEVLKASA
jgi:thiamine biosynthesis lipoprotein